MNADLQRLIDLQRLDLAGEDARRRIADEPRRTQDLEARLDAARQAVADAKQRLADSQAARRAVEKDLAVVQGRLSKYKDQLMEVKTNREYQAMQKEIETAQHDVRAFEDKILDNMLQADELGSHLKAAEAALKQEEGLATAERAALKKEAVELAQQLDTSSAERARLVATIDRGALATYERVAKGRKGVAVAAARDGHCTLCHVRLRPQMYNDVRRNEFIIQCDSCQRILYFDPAPQPAASQPASSSPSA